MTDISNDQISALMDGEAANIGPKSIPSAAQKATSKQTKSQGDDAVDRLVQAVQTDSQARQKWARYHLMRDVLQNDYNPEMGAVLGADFASKVAKAVAAEPTVVVFDTTATSTDTDANPALSGHSESQPAVGAKVSPLVPPAASVPEAQFETQLETQFEQQPSANWRRNVTGLAVAASVAVVSVVGLNLWRDGTQNQVSTTNTIAADNPALQELVAGSQRLELVANRGTYWTSTTAKALSKQNEDKLNMFLSQHIENAPTAHNGMFPYSRLVGYDKVRGE